MSEIFNGARQAADIIGKAFRNPEQLWAREQKANMLAVLREEPTEDEMAQFEALRLNGTIYLGEFGVMGRVNQNISVGINLRSGYYDFGQFKLTDGLLFLARRLGGWEDPTGASLKQSEKSHS